MKTKTIGERLEALQNEYSLTTEKFAAVLGMSRVGLDNIIKGKSNPIANTLEAIATKTGTTKEWLQTGKGEMLPNGKKDLTSKSTSLNPWENEAFLALKEEVAFYRQLITQLTGGKTANFLKALNGTGLPKNRSLGAAA